MTSLNILVVIWIALSLWGLYRVSGLVLISVRVLWRITRTRPFNGDLRPALHEFSQDWRDGYIMTFFLMLGLIAITPSRFMGAYAEAIQFISRGGFILSLVFMIIGIEARWWYRSRS